jgi:hypothetical protein
MRKHFIFRRLFLVLRDNNQKERIKKKSREGMKESEGEKVEKLN